ncbi:MAG: glycosyltransferase [Trueperella sp.]|uniref:glycosyltransferase n=1 Tax=Trueperella sp. TaxID=2699835 RepID=UPI0025F48C93|nr:glycosyltransferase [Trueperella sp.]MCI7306397.1 glycosyltransferase [Trueperella sp.]
MARALVMLTDNYPFNVGEEFIEQEIDVVCAQFDKVLIIPMRTRRADAKQTRALPANAVAVAPASSVPLPWWATTVLRVPQVLMRAPSLYENCPFKDRTRALIDARFSANAVDLFNQVRKIISKEVLSQFESVVFYAYWLHTPAAVGVLMRRYLMDDARKGVVVSRAHAYDVDERDSRYKYLPARRFLLDELDHIYPISNYAAQFLRDHGERRPGQIQVRRLGVPEVPVVDRKRSQTVSILSCSHMAPYKRIDLMTEAIGELEKRGWNVHWRHIGESNPDRLAHARELADRLCPRSTVEFLGHLPNAETRRRYSAPDITLFLNTSDGEGVPVSVMEAQAAGLPVVATAAGGTPEIVRHGVNGAVVPVQTSAAEIADAIEKVAGADDGAYQRMCEAARQTWSQMSNARRQYEDFAQHLAELSHEAARRARSA